ncbi:deoxyribodipyrimidine photo-lyase [Ferrovibrio sp.]|uniref:cryptochrome/photolyase family protein n=1 Tax=Ferrovibrio sp. TaxID=1917215 RepID=UPI0025C293B2|nr:deoxyribodipyrimidine photo-lyase [Ferrovibrio sp.]MBX3455542.1 deoxyribodipyrimidine photo-lyase [Ferrovibrio sp.]
MAEQAAPALLWFRQDLRLADNPALHAAMADGRPVLPVYILEDGIPGGIRSWGGASLWWLHHALAALDSDLRKRHGSGLLLLRGDPRKLLPALATQVSAAALHWNRRYDAEGIAVDTEVKARVKALGLSVESHKAALLHEPWEIRNQSGSWFKVFTPFWRACQQTGAPAAPLPAPKKLRLAALPKLGDSLKDWRLLPSKPDWAGGLRKSWTPGEAGAAAQLADFLDHRIKGYTGNRDRPDLPGTSRLSPHLHFGEISPRQIWHAARMREDAGSLPSSDLAKFLSEIGWREFSHHLLFHFPDLPSRNFRPEFDAFPWRTDKKLLQAWQRGRTGYPIVDAGMRELWQTGWMHNRVRMIVASFLVKHLGQDWRNGEAWFWDTLVDADAANNAASWQWVAGSGADAAPYFRIFNPMLQGERFDPAGVYIRRWLPELSALPDAWLHKPWAAPESVLRAAKLALGKDYPHPVVDHATAREKALAAFASLRDKETDGKASKTVAKKAAKGAA